MKQVRLISSMAAKSFLADIAAQYERETGTRIVVTAVGGVDVMRRVRSGEATELIVLSAEQIDQLAADARIVPGSRTDLVKSGVAVAVRQGAARPDIGSPATLRDAVRAAQSIGYSTGPSGVYLERLLARWEVPARVKRVQAPPGVPVGELVARGEVEIGFQQLSELIHLPGIEVLGALPPEVQLFTVFSGGLSVSAGAAQAEAARAALAYMAAPAAAEAKRHNGLTPA
jgi:molybdate transport system substrate-binding protein